jgi:multidrug efflux pump subunit AcrB
MTLMLTSSLVLCVTVAPRLVATPAVAPGPARAPSRRIEGGVLFATRHRWVGIVVPCVFVLAMVPLGLTIGTGFLPEMDEGSLILDYVAPPGTSITETDRMLREVERDIDRIPEIAAWSRRTGNQLGFFITEPNTGDYVLRLKKHRRRSAEAIADALRQRIEATQPALEVEFGQLIEDVVGDLTTNPQPIEVRILGADRPGLEQRARQVARVLSAVPGVVDVKSGVVVSGPNVSVVPAPAAQRFGIGAPELSRAVAPYLQGVEAGEILRGARSWPMRVVLPRGDGPSSPQALADVRVPVAAGRWVRLGDIATLRIEPGETEIHHDNGRPMVAATARLTERDLGSAMADIQPRIRQGVPLGPGMTVRYAGLWAEQQSSFRGLAGVLAGAILAVLLILLAAFRSWRAAGAVLLVVVASLVGVFLALRIGGVTFNIASFVGAIMVVGIVAENAYFLVAAHQQALAQGSGPEEAAFAAARRRLRPILMTTAAGVAALAPLALGLGAGSALLRPLAIAVVGGFVTSSPLLLGVLPSLLAGIAPAAD